MPAIVEFARQYLWIVGSALTGFMFAQYFKTKVVMPRRFPKFVCEGCKNTVDEYPDFHLCPYCAGQFRAIWRLYTKVCEVRAGVRSLSPAEFVHKLWAWFEKKA